MEITREYQIAAIDEGQQRLGISANALEIKAGLKQGTINDLRRGKTQVLRADKWHKLVRALELEDTDEERPQIPVIAEVGAGAEVYPIDDLPLMGNVKSYERDYVNCEFVETPPGYYPYGLVAVRVKGDSWDPYIRTGEILFYERKVCDFSEGLNEKCIVALTDGKVYFKVLKKGTMPGKYHLISPNAPMIEDVEIEWCAVVVDITPRLRLQAKASRKI